MRSHIMSICLLMGFTSLQSCKTATNREPSASLMAAASSNKIVLNKIYRGHGNLTFTSATKFKWKAISGIGMRTAEGTYSVEDGKVTVDKAKVVSTDVAASNGVIHAIDTVLMPK